MQIAARLEARFGVRVALAQNMALRQIKFRDGREIRWYRNFIRAERLTGPEHPEVPAAEPTVLESPHLILFRQKSRTCPKKQRQPNILHSVFLVPRGRTPRPTARTRETVRARHRKNRGRCIAREQCRASRGCADADEGSAFRCRL